MWSSAASKALITAVDLAISSAASMTRSRRTLMCSASASRLVHQPPDLIQWVRKEGGFVHPKVKIANHGYDGLGISSAGEISAGSDLIVLPGHIPLRFERSAKPDVRDSAIMKLSGRIPAGFFKLQPIRNQHHLADVFTKVLLTTLLFLCYPR